MKSEDVQQATYHLDCIHVLQGAVNQCSKIPARDEFAGHLYALFCEYQAPGRAVITQVEKEYIMGRLNVTLASALGKLEQNHRTAATQLGVEV